MDGEWSSTRGHPRAVARRRSRHNKHSQKLGGIPPERKDRNMKNITKTIAYLQMTALFLTASLAGLGAAGKAVPFKGTIQAFETTDFDPVTMILLVDGSGTGQAAHLGQFTYTYEFVVDLTAGVGSAEFTDANGDSLLTTITGLPGSGPTDTGFRVVEGHTIVGGTGRFAGASGSFTLDRLLTAIGTSNVSVGTVHGTIVFHKAKHTAK